MATKETESRFLGVLGGCLVSLPSDLKVLQEALADEDLERPARELAAGAVVHALTPREGDKILRYAEDALLARATLAAVATTGGEGAAAFRERFPEVYDALDEQLVLFRAELGELWGWLVAKLDQFPKLVYKRRPAAQYVDDEEAEAFLYEEGLAFATNYSITDEQVRNRLRRADALIEALERKRAEEARKIG